MASSTLYGLTDAQVQRLARMLSAVETSDVPPLSQGARTPPTASRILIGLLESEVSATTSLTGTPKVGTLNVYSFSSTGTVDTAVDETVYNFAPQAATTDRWTVTERCSFSGKLIITTQFCS